MFNVHISLQIKSFFRFLFLLFGGILGLREVGKLNFTQHTHKGDVGWLQDFFFLAKIKTIRIELVMKKHIRIQHNNDKESCSMRHKKNTNTNMLACLAIDYPCENPRSNCSTKHVS